MNDQSNPCDDFSRPEEVFQEEQECLGEEGVYYVVRLLVGRGLGPVSRYIPWCLWGGFGVLLVLGASLRLGLAWDTLLSKDAGDVRASPLVQGYYAFQAARELPSDCADKARGSPAACEANLNCRWNKVSCAAKTAPIAPQRRSRHAAMLS